MENNNGSSRIYQENKVLPDMYINSCKNTLTGAEIDICTLGEIGSKITKESIKNNYWLLHDTQGFSKLISIAEKYNEAYLFSIIGDLYVQNNKQEDAKRNYAKALSLTTNQQEQDILQNKISQLK